MYINVFPAKSGKYQTQMIHVNVFPAKSGKPENQAGKFKLWQVILIVNKINLTTGQQDEKRNAQRMACEYAVASYSIVNQCDYCGCSFFAWMKMDTEQIWTAQRANKDYTHTLTLLKTAILSSCDPPQDQEPRFPKNFMTASGHQVGKWQNLAGWYTRECLELRTKNLRLHRESWGNMRSWFLVPWENAFFPQRMHSSIRLSRLWQCIHLLSRTDRKHTACIYTYVHTCILK